MAGLFLTAPLVLALLVGLVVAGFVLARRAPSAVLPLPVADARRRGNVFSTFALAGGVVVLAGLGALAVERGSEVLVLLTPLWAATVHAAVCLLGELTGPRPAARVRGARLVARSIRDSAPTLLWWTSVAATLLVVALCVAASAVVGTCGVLIVMWSGFFSVYGGYTDLEGNLYDGPLSGVTDPLVYTGLLVVLAGIVVLLVPARGVRA